MSNIAVMQPYFFPYIGYFQLINAVDEFIFYDDVDFIKNGWINRNRVLINGDAKYMTIPCKDVSSNKLIKNIKHGLNEKTKNKLLKKVRFTYSQAPFFEKVFDLISNVLSNTSELVSDLAIQSVKQTSHYLGIDVHFMKSSESFSNQSLDAADRLIDICKARGASRYVNPIGGQKLYDKGYFRKKGITLQFLEPSIQKYIQFNNEFVPALSIIDVMMFNSSNKITSELLNTYRIL